MIPESRCRSDAEEPEQTALFPVGPSKELTNWHPWSCRRRSHILESIDSINLTWVAVMAIIGYKMQPRVMTRLHTLRRDCRTQMI
ncbi:MAG: hypothetical protein E7113_07250 [Bacteroidales bacterium]|nr:hypothetical protein [Bacteroidales bacterium]